MPELGFDPLKSPFEQAVKNLQARISRGLSADKLSKIAAGGAPRPDIHWNWHDTLAHQHASSFVVARMAETDLLKAVHGSLVRAQREGWSYDRWAKAIAPQMKSAGWWGKQERLNPKTGKMELVQLGSPRRLKIIYQTNMRVSMMAAHYKSLKEAAEYLPLWRYVARMDNKTRPSHAALHNKVFRHDHPFWSTHFPPNGWLCRCTVVGESDSTLSNLTKEVAHDNQNLPKVTPAEPAPEVIPETEVPTITMEQVPSLEAAPVLREGVQRKTVPVATFRGVRPDPGWSHNPGQMLWARETMLVDHIRELPPAVGKAMIDKIARTDYSPWSSLAEAVKQQGGIKGIKRSQEGEGKQAADSFVIRWMPNDLVTALRQALKAADLDPYLTTDKTQLWHAIRPAKNVQPQGSHLVPWEEFAKLPSHLADAQTIYLDRDDPGTVAIASPYGKDLIKSVFRVTEVDGRQTLSLVTTGVVKPAAFSDARRWSAVPWNGGWGKKAVAR